MKAGLLADFVNVSGRPFGSAPVTVRSSIPLAATVMLPGFTTTGAPSLESTTIENDSVSLRNGSPSSVARTVTVYVPNRVGVQTNWPNVLIVAPAGAPGSRE